MSPADRMPVRRLVSWNVLADAYIRAGYYPRVDPALLRRGARTAAIVDAIARDSGELFCLQEVEAELVDAMRARLVDWQVRFAAKAGKPDGCAILARPGVALADVERLGFADGDPDRSDSGHIALLATVEIGGERVRLATTHVRWDPPGTPVGQRWAIREVRELLSVLTPPAIACGDFNFEDDDDAYRLFLDRGFVDPHAAAPHPTCHTSGRAKRIDFILCTPSVAARVAASGTPGGMVIVDDQTVIPSMTMPSDHVPVAIEFDRVAPTCRDRRVIGSV